MEHLKDLLNNIENILEWMNFKENQIETSHFFIDNEDKEYSDIDSFINFFSNTNTGNMLIKDLDIGLAIKKALIILSFDDVYGDITISFTENDWEGSEVSTKEISRLILDRLNDIKNNITYTSILFGYEPADHEYMTLFNVHK